MYDCLLIAAGEAWYNEDEDSESPKSPVSATVGHIDHALLPQKFYFQTSSAPPHAPPSSPYHHISQSSSQSTTAEGKFSTVCQYSVAVDIYRITSNYGDTF